MAKYEGKRTFEATESEMVHFFVEHCKKYGTSTKGVYNNADPTHYEKVKVQFLTHDQNDPEKYNKLDVEIEDVTWFIKIEFLEYGNPLADGMWDPQGQCFVNVSLNGDAFFDLLRRALFESEHQSDFDQEDQLDAMGYNER